MLPLTERVSIIDFDWVGPILDKDAIFVFFLGENIHVYLMSSSVETFTVGVIFLIKRESSVTNLSSFALAK